MFFVKKMFSISISHLLCLLCRSDADSNQMDVDPDLNNVCSQNDSRTSSSTSRHRIRIASSSDEDESESVEQKVCTTT